MHTRTHMCRICTHIGCIVITAMLHGTCQCAVFCHLWRAAQWLLLNEEELDNALVVLSLLWQNGRKRNLKEGLLSLVVWWGTVHDGGRDTRWLIMLCPQSGSREQWILVLTLSSCVLFGQPRASTYWMLLTLRVGLPSSAKSLWTDPHRHAHGCVFSPS